MPRPTAHQQWTEDQVTPLNVPGKTNSSITIEDPSIGITKNEFLSNLGAVARSGIAAFRKAAAVGGNVEFASTPRISPLTGRATSAMATMTNRKSLGLLGSAPSRCRRRQRWNQHHPSLEREPARALAPGGTPPEGPGRRTRGNHLGPPSSRTLGSPRGLGDEEKQGKDEDKDGQGPNVEEVSEEKVEGGREACQGGQGCLPLAGATLQDRTAVGAQIRGCCS